MSIFRTFESKIHILIIATTLACASSTVIAVPMYSVDTSETVYIGSSASRNLSYNSISQLLTSDISNTFSSNQTGPFLTFIGLQSNLNISANIDNSGNLIDGDVIFTGGGVEGIALNTLLMSGKIIDFSYVLTSSDEITDVPNGSFVPVFEFIVEVTDSLVELGFAELLDFRYRYTPQGSVFDPFMNNFTGHAYTGENIFAATKINVIPEPSIWLLFFVGIMAMLGINSRFV